MKKQKKNPREIKGKEIKKATLQDIKRITTLFNQTDFLADKVEHSEDTYYNLVDIRDYMSDKKVETFKYMIGKIIAGFAMVFYRKQYFMRFLVVDKKYYRKGIGTALLKFTENRAFKKGIKYAESTTLSSNNSIAKMLLKNGYRRGEKHYFWFKKLFQNN